MEISWNELNNDTIVKIELLIYYKENETEKTHLYKFSDVYENNFIINSSYLSSFQTSFKANIKIISEKFGTASNQLMVGSGIVSLNSISREVTITD